MRFNRQMGRLEIRFDTWDGMDDTDSDDYGFDMESDYDVEDETESENGDEL